MEPSCQVTVGGVVFFERFNATQFPKHWCEWVKLRKTLIEEKATLFDTPEGLYFRLEGVEIRGHFQDQINGVIASLKRHKPPVILDARSFMNNIVDVHFEMQWPCLRGGQTRSRRPVLDGQQPVTFDDAFRAYVEKLKLATKKQTGHMDLTKMQAHQRVFTLFNHFQDIPEAPAWWKTWYTQIEEEPVRDNQGAVDVYEYYYMYHGIELASLPTNLHLDPIRDQIVEWHMKLWKMREQVVQYYRQNRSQSAKPLDEKTKLQYFPFPSYRDARASHFNKHYASEKYNEGLAKRAIEEERTNQTVLEQQERDAQMLARKRYERAMREAEEEAERLHPTKVAHTQSYTGSAAPALVPMPFRRPLPLPPVPSGPVPMELDEFDDDTPPVLEIDRDTEDPRMRVPNRPLSLLSPEPLPVEIDEDTKHPDPPPILFRPVDVRQPAAGHPMIESPRTQLLEQLPEELRTQMYFFVDSSVAPLFMMDGNLVVDQKEQQTEYKLSESLAKIYSNARDKTSTSAVFLQALWGACRAVQNAKSTVAMKFVMDVLGTHTRKHSFYTVQFKPQGTSSVWKMYVPAPNRVEISPGNFKVRDHVDEWNSDVSVIEAQLTALWGKPHYQQLVQQAVDSGKKLPTKVTVRVGITPAIITYIKQKGYTPRTVMEIDYAGIERKLADAYLQVHKKLGVEECTVTVFHVMDMFTFSEVAKSVVLDPLLAESAPSLSTPTETDQPRERMLGKAIQFASNLLLDKFSALNSVIEGVDVNVYLFPRSVDRGFTKRTNFVIGKHSFRPPGEQPIDLYTSTSPKGSMNFYVSDVVDDNSNTTGEEYIIPADEDIFVPDAFIRGLVNHFKQSPNKGLSFKFVETDRNDAGTRTIRNPVTFTVPGTIATLPRDKVWTLQLREYGRPT